MEALSPTAIRDGLGTEVLGCRILCYETVDSTNLVAKALAQQGDPEGTLVIANHQTAGRGRLDRRWLAPAGTSLLFSLILRPNLPVARAQGLTMISGLGMRDAIVELTGLPVRLKWPNDIVLHGRKLGGILTESSSRGLHLEYAIVGIGLNVNLAIGALPPTLRATSLLYELGHCVSRVRLLQSALKHMELHYVGMCQGAWPVQQWSDALETIGQQVEVHTSLGTWRGQAMAVDEEGALLLRLADGHLQRLVAGDIISLPAD